MKSGKEIAQKMMTAEKLTFFNKNEDKYADRASFLFSKDCGGHNGIMSGRNDINQRQTGIFIQYNLTFGFILLSLHYQLLNQAIKRIIDDEITFYTH